MRHGGIGAIALVGILPLGACANGGTPTGGGSGGAGASTSSAATASTSSGALGGSGTATTSGSSGGSPGNGGSAGSTGSTSSASSTGSGGSTSDGGAACPGVAIVPDPTGYIAPGTNSVGIHGSWFVYSDCQDLMGKDCSMVTSPTGTGFANVGGKMCTSGQTSTATGAWGAGIAFELNDDNGQQPYDATTYGVTGFCLQLSGTTIPSTTIRVAFPTQENNDNAPFLAVSTPGMHPVLFSETAQGSWVTTPTTFDPTKIMLVQFQIPSSTTAPVPWDFCIEGVTAITQ